MNNQSNGFDTPTPTMHRAGQIIAEQAGQRRVTLTAQAEGVVGLELDLPPLRKLILSGGGAKGIAYAGAVTALENHGALAGVEALYGSSAGAIMAAFIAAGMSAAEFDTLSDETSLLSLLDSPQDALNWLQQVFSRAGEEVENALPGKLGSYSRLLLSVLPRIQSSAQPLQNLIREKTRQALLARLMSPQALDLGPEVALIRERLTDGGVVTFADLARLSRDIPQIKTLNVTGTGMFDGRPQLLVFNDELTPDMDIAAAVHISAALPVVFGRPDGQGLAFQEGDEVTWFQDGGVLLNTPVPQLIDSRFTQDLLSRSDMLIFKFEKKEKASRPGGWGGLLKDWLAGAPTSAARDYQRKRLQEFVEQTVIVPLNTELGDFRSELNGTLNFTMSPEIKNHLQERLQQAVEAYLEARADKRERYDFASLEDALLRLDDEMLASVQQQGVVAAAQVLTWRQFAAQALDELDQAITAANAAARLELTPGIEAALGVLDQLATDAARSGWLVEQLNQPQRRNFQQLLQALRSRDPGSAVWQAATAEMQQRDIQAIASNIRQAVIFPSLHLLGQTAGNIDLLLRCDQWLVEARTAAQVNVALDELISGYRSRNPLLGKPWRSRTIDMAKAWRIKE